MAELTCGATCAKYLLFVFNFIFFVCGAVVLGIGIWLLADKSSFIELTKVSSDVTSVTDSINTPGVLEAAAITLIVAGVVTFIVAFLGCFGAIKEWRPLLITYAVFLFIILILLISAGIAAGAFKDNVESTLESFLNNTLIREYGKLDDNDKPTPISAAWDQMQYSLECCGVESGADYGKGVAGMGPINWANGPIGDWQIPPTCCRIADNTRTLDETVFNELIVKGCMQDVNNNAVSNYDKGCSDALYKWITDNGLIVAGVSIGLGIVQIFGIIFALCLCTAIGKAQGGAV
ncbi:PREDICTED: CD82 antigen-like isoform X2 [Priapulus caudatus]|nr:PREDICTED: CD82 antigen-like isoform X2 [Priapulus caudatus]XP_014667316.1 PREDICTED: CD82 antigen-like isoform X2 [Priapulus caudatus]XP_014667317.1 PREDICTED: CD82 antigen-like isoform X2 [Priapulus caudatus]XP_014667318.1 PREDICTED: CD82 antigen-like isoform X2 [Priapulus caudatus]